MPLFEGGTLKLDQNNANYNFNFSLNNATTNTIDAAGLTSTFSGSFSNTSNQTGTIRIQDSVGGGSVIFSGANTFTGSLNIVNASFSLSASGSLVAPTNISSGSTLINNLGLMNGAVNNASGGTVQNAGTIAGAISNSGTLNNNNGGIVSGVLTNNANGTVTNGFQITNAVFNNGVFTNGIPGNNGYITGNITNAQGGQFFNNSTISVGITITNNGNFTNYENVQSTFINGGTGTVVNVGNMAIMDDIINEVSGVIINSSGINNVTNNGTLYLNGNTAQITGGITGTGTVQINGNFTQEAPISNGAINVAGAFSQIPLMGGVPETTANSLSVGVAGYAAGSLNLLGNLTVGTAEIGGASGSTGVVNMKGGRFATGNLSVGDHGNGTLNLIVGTLSVGNGTGTLMLASQEQSIGTLNIGTASIPGFGTLQAGSIIGGAGTAILNFNYSGNYTFAPNIYDSVSVNQLGNGTLTLAGNNNYYGTTTVTSGTLASGNGSGRYLILQNGGAYSPGPVNSIDTVTVGSITLNGGDLLYNLGNATSDRINLESYGVAELNGPVVFDFSNLGYSAGTFTLLTGNGVSTFNTANLSYNAAGNFSVSGNFVVSGNSLLFQTVAPAANYTWTGGAGNGNWTNSANWVTPPVAGATIHFAGANQTSVDTDTNQSVGGIVFNSGASAFTISNNTITLAGNVENDSTNTQTINSTLALGKNIHFAADSGNLAFGGPISLGANFLAVSGANSTTISGNISGTGGLLKRGPGNLTLSGINTYTGNTSINGGNLIVQGGAALLDTGTVTLAASGATLTIGTSETIGSLQGGGTTAITANQTLTIAQAGNATYAGSISGAGALTKNGAGTLTLTGNNTYTGATYISAGPLAISGLLGGGNYSANITNNGSLLFTSTSNQTFGGVISGTGALTQNGSGTLTLTGNNTYTGNTNIISGTLQMAGGTSSSDYFTAGLSAGQTGALDMAGGAWTGIIEGVLGYSAGSAGMANMTGGTWSMEEFVVGNSGNGTLNLSGGNLSVDMEFDIAGAASSTGVANVSGGTLATGDFYVGLEGNGTLNLTGGVVSIGNGAGNLTLASQAGSFGILNLGNGSTVGSLYAASVVGGSGTAIVNFNNNANATFTPVLSGNLTVNKLGTGALTLSANNTYTGSTTISAGTLAISGLLGGGNYSANITNNGSLLFASTSNQTLGGVISGTGALTQNGTGTLTLSGNNTYTGATNINSGTVRISGGTFSSGLAIAGNSAGSTGTLEMAGGTFNSAAAGGQVLVGYLGGSTGVANMTGGTWTVYSFEVGAYGNGTLNFSGGNLSGNYVFVIGSQSNSTGVVNMSSGTLVAGEFFVGDDGNGTLNLTGGNVSVSRSIIGNNESVANISGGAWSSQNYLNIAGTLNITGGTVSNGNGTIANETPNGNATVNVSGGQWLNSNELVVGNTQNGTLNLTGGMVVIANGAGNLTLGANGSVGTFNLGNGSTVGSLYAASVVGGSGTGIVNFNNDADYAFAPILSGNLTMNKLGNGALTLSANNTYTGSTTISAGTLLVTGAIGSSPATIVSGATIGGNGTLGGNLTLAAGSNLAFNPATSLAVNGSSVSFGNFSLSNLTGFNGSSSSLGGFTVLGGTAKVNTENLNNYGPANSETFGSNEVFFFTKPNGTNLKLAVVEAIQDLYWVGNNGTSWGSENWSINPAATTGNASLDLNATLDLHFASTGANATNTAATTLSANTTVRHLMVSSGGNVGIGGTGVTLTLNSTQGPSLHLTGSASNVTISVPVIVAGGGIQIDEGNLEVTSVSGSAVEVGIAAGASFAFNTNSTLSFNGTIAGGGSFAKHGNGTVTLTGNNTYTGPTNITSGTLAVAGGTLTSDYFRAGISSGETGAVDMTGGTWAGIVEGWLGYSTGSTGMANMTGGTWAMEEFVVGNSGNGTLNLTGGAVTIGTGTMTLANSAGSFGTLNLGNGSSTGSLLALRVVGGSGTGTVNFNNNADDTFAPALAGNLSVNKLGTGTLTLTGNNTYTGASAISAGTLAFNSAYTQTLPGIVSGAGSLLKAGSGSLILTGNNTLTGGTTLAGGVLQTIHAKALGNGALTLSSGTMALGNATTTNLSLSGLTDLVWSSSNAVISLANGGNIVASGNFTNGGNSGNRTFYFGSGQALQLGNNTLVQFGGSTNFTASNFVASYTGNFTINGAFSMSGDKLIYSFGGGNATGNVIDNSNPFDTPVWVDFIVNGSTGNGTVITLGGNNTIRDLTFTNNGNLAIQAGYALTLSQGQVAVAHGSSVVSGGTLATPGNFNKTGAGELDVQSTLSVNGTASIDAGLLSVNGNLIANSVAVNSGAILGGSGTIFAPVTISGTLAPGNSPGTLSVASLTLTPTAVTDIEIESLTNFDRIVVGGAATVDGTLNVIPYNGNPLAYGQQYAFLTAGGGISGEFDTITAPETFRGRFLNLGTTGILLIAPDTYTRVAVTPNQRNVAVALDTFIPATSGDQQTVSIALDLQTAEQYPTAFEQIMPGFYESLANIAIEQTYNQAQLLTQRMGMVRLGVQGFQAMGISQPIKYDKDGKSAADAKTASPIVESAMATNWNSWVMANGEFSLSRGLSGVPNYKNNAGGFLVGADYRLSENFAAGLFAGYEYSYAKYDGGSSTAGNSALFGLYGSYTHEDGYYADAVVSGGYTGFQTRRSIEFSTIDRTARANPNSGQFSAALNLGKDFEIGKFTLGPIIGAQYTYAGIGGFTETGADSLDLALGQQNANSLRSNLGARLAYNWEVGSNITLIPEIRAFWMHEFLNNSRNISSALDGGNGASFDYETEAPYRNSIFGGVGVSAKVGDRWNASVFYNVNFGSENYTNNIISTSLGFSF